MAVEERVVIKVDIDADISGDLAAIERRIKALENRQRSLNRETDSGSRINDRMERSNNKLSNSLGKMGGVLKTVTGALKSFLMTLSKFSFIAVAAEVALFTAGLLAVKAALVTGRVAIRGYQAALRGLSAVTAGVATALAVAAAAMREFQEAQLAPFLGGGQAGTIAGRRLNRSLTAQTRGLYGGEAAGAVAGSLARAGITSGNRVATQLFNLSGGDAKAAQQLASAFAGAKQSGNTNELVKALQGSAGYRADSLKSGMSLSQIISTVSGGGATSSAFGGVAEDMAKTFIGTLKGELESFKSIFATIGEPLLGTFRSSFLQISSILKNDIMGIAGALQKFGARSFAPSLVSIADAVGEFVRSNIVQNIDNISGMATSIMNWFKGVGNWFNSVGAWLRQFEPAANVVLDMFRAMSGAAGGNNLFKNFSRMVEENSDAFIKFGESIGKVVYALMNALGRGQGGFFAALDRMSQFFSVVAANVVPMLADIMTALVPLFDQLPGVLADITRGLGPTIIQILEALKPIFDKLPDIMSGVIQVVNALAPIVMGLIRALDMALGALGAVPGGGMVTGALAIGGYALLGTKGGRAMLGRGMRNSFARAGVGAGAAGRAASAGAAGAAGAARGAAGTRVGGRVMGLLDDAALRSMYAYESARAIGQFGPALSRGQTFMRGRGTGLGYNMASHYAAMRNGQSLSARMGAGYLNSRFGGSAAGRYLVGGSQFNPARSGKLLSGASARAFGALSAFNVGQDMFRAGGPGEYLSYAANENIEDPLGQGMKYGTAASLIPIPGVGMLVGGTLAGVGGARNINKYGANMGNVATTVGGFGMAGAGIGTMIGGPFGTLIGGALGTLVGGVAAGIQTWRRDKRIKENTVKAGQDIIKSLTDSAVDGISESEFVQQSQLKELAQSAMDAGWTTKGFTEGDTRQMDDLLNYLVQIGEIDYPITEIHRDNFITNELPAILDRLARNEEQFFREQEMLENQRLERLTENLNMLANTLDVSTDAIQEFADTLKIDLSSAMLNMEGFGAMFKLFNAPSVDLMQGFGPDVSRTLAYAVQSSAGADAALTTLAQSSRAGTFTPSEMQDFLDQYSSAEIALGGTPALAGLSALQEIERQAGLGTFGDEAQTAKFMDMFNVAGMRQGVLTEMSDTYGISRSKLSDVLGAGGVNALGGYLEQVGTQREIARTAMFGSGASQIESFIGMGGGEMLTPDLLAKISGSGDQMLSLATRSFMGGGMSQEEYLAQVQARYGDGDGQGLSQLMTDWLVQSGDSTDKQVGLLQGIIDAVEGNVPSISINGTPTSDRGGSMTFSWTTGPVNANGGGYRSSRVPGRARG